MHKYETTMMKMRKYEDTKMYNDESTEYLISVTVQMYILFNTMYLNTVYMH